MTFSSALVTTIHRVLALHRIDLAGISQAVRIPLATVQRVTTPSTAPIALSSWEGMVRLIDATVTIEYQGERYPVDLPALNQKRLQEAHDRLAERAYTDRTIRTVVNPRTKAAISREQVRREIAALRHHVTEIIVQSLPPGKHPSSSLFAPIATLITSVAAAGALGRSYETLELVTGIPSRTHRKLCAPDDQRPIAILQTVLGLVGMVVVVECTKTRWDIGTTPPPSQTFVKVANVGTGATRGAPAHEHLPLAPSQILAVVLGERSMAEDFTRAGPRVGILPSTIKHWERQRRDPTLEALETMTKALGGHVALHGRLERRITPIGPTPERLQQTFRQTCSAYRWSVSRATGLTEAPLMAEIHRRVEHTRARVNEHLRLMPSTEAAGIVDWIRARRAVLQLHALGSVLELSLITGLNRRIIDRILLDVEPLDGPHLRALSLIGITVTVSTTTDSRLAP